MCEKNVNKEAFRDFKLAQAIILNDWEKNPVCDLTLEISEKERKIFEELDSLYANYYKS